MSESTWDRQLLLLERDGDEQRRENLLLRERQAVMRGAREPGGTACPVCDHHVQVYRRTINAGMAVWLIAFVRWLRCNQSSVPMLARWVDLRAELPAEIQTLSRDYAKLRWWGLLEPHPNRESRRPQKKTSGVWRLTGRGLAYVHNEVSVPRAVFEKRSEVISVEEPSESVTAALGCRFNYEDLMWGRA